ncbi:MAG: VOC family protein [Spirochaetales bacterium]|nr:VOC family protein [Spirochaetales bacterium]
MKFNKLIPELSVTDINKSKYFYVDILNFKIEYEREEDKFIFLSLNESQIMLEQYNGNWLTGKLEYPFGRGINFQFEVDDISFLLNNLSKSNYPIFIKPEENWYRVGEIYTGNREFLVQDPDGYLLRFSRDLGEQSAIIPPIIYIILRY